MNLYYINLGLHYQTYIKSNNALRYKFQQEVSFICDYLSKKIRKHRFKTDGTFNSIHVACTEFDLNPTKIIPNNVLQVFVPFDYAQYETAISTQNFQYYLDLFYAGFTKASTFKHIPLEQLQEIIEEFRINGCKNEWIHKKKKFKDNDIEVKLICEFTSSAFQLRIEITKISTKDTLVNGIVIRTDTGVFIHEGTYKDIHIDNDIVITDSCNVAIIVVDLKKALNRDLQYRIVKDDNIKKILTYGLPNPATSH